MSKSLRNFFTVREVANVYGYEPIRYLMISCHYRSPINYSTDSLEQCRASLERLYTCRDSIDFALKNAVDGEMDGQDGILQQFESRKTQFISAMDDDLNTADALAAIFELVRDINIALLPKNSPSKKVCGRAGELLFELCDVLGLLYVKNESSLEDEVEALIEQRNAARKSRDFALADKIRDDLKDRGIVLEDTPQGVKWRQA